MTTIQITLPDDLARKADRSGLLDPARIESMFRDQLDAQADQEFRTMREKVKADTEPPMSYEEIQAEIDAVRAEKRRAAGH